jgi:hypothetical protein
MKGNALNLFKGSVEMLLKFKNITNIRFDKFTPNVCIIAFKYLLRRRGQAAADC